jgi:hypothetical protein
MTADVFVHVSALHISGLPCLLTACIGVGADISAALPTEILMPFAVIESCSA